MSGPFDGRQAAALRPYIGKWVALGAPDEVLASAENPDDLVRKLRNQDLHAPGGIFRVPTSPQETEGAAPQ
jgi:hypothetical protein